MDTNQPDNSYLDAYDSDILVWKPGQNEKGYY